MIIKIGQEEYMDYDGAGDNVKYGRLGDQGDYHQLFKVLLFEQKIVFYMEYFSIWSLK